MFLLEAKLPPDVLRYVIVPMLDLDSRVAFNRCLVNPITRRLKQDVIEDHQLTLTTTLVTDILHKVDESFKIDERAHGVTKAFRLVITAPHHLLLHRHPTLRITFYQKAHEFLLRDKAELATTHRNIYNLLIATCNDVIQFVDAYYSLHTTTLVRGTDSSSSSPRDEGEEVVSSILATS